MTTLAANGVVERHLAGTVVTEHLRGSSLLSPVAQAAAIAVHERFGPGGARDVHAAGIRTIGKGRWRVELQCSGVLPARVTADVEARQAATAVLTCRAVKPTAARNYEVTDLHAV